MKRNLIMAAIVGLLTAGFAQGQATSNSETSGTHYSHSRLQQMERAPQQYQVLSEYLERRQRSFQQKADAEKEEWERRSQNVSGPAEKYPRPVDSARNLYQYYAYEALQSGILAEQYQRLAQSVASHGPSL